jgi:hypothetical protein
MLVLMAVFRDHQTTNIIERFNLTGSVSPLLILRPCLQKLLVRQAKMHQDLAHLLAGCFYLVYHVLLRLRLNPITTIVTCNGLKVEAQA